MNILSESEIKDGWKLLFDGNTLSGWHGYNKDYIGQGWQVNDGTLYFDGSKEEHGKMTCNDIVTNDTFSDFHLKIDWKISANGNSGIMFHVLEDPAYRTPWMTGPEMQVLDNDGHQDGQLSKHRAGDLYDLIASRVEAVKPVGEWNQAEILLRNKQLEFVLNGKTIVSPIMGNSDWDELVAASKFKDMPGFARSWLGTIALQDHGDPVWFRNIKIKVL